MGWNGMDIWLVRQIKGKHMKHLMKNNIFKENTRRHLKQKKKKSANCSSVTAAVIGSVPPEKH